jgi:hypothetical protein
MRDTNGTLLLGIPSPVRVPRREAYSHATPAVRDSLLLSMKILRWLVASFCQQANQDDRETRSRTAQMAKIYTITSSLAQKNTRKTLFKPDKPLHHCKTLGMNTFSFMLYRAHKGLRRILVDLLNAGTRVIEPECVGFVP